MSIHPPLITGQTVHDPINPEYRIKVNPNGSININVIAAGAARPNSGQPALIHAETVNDPDNPQYAIKVNADGSINVNSI